MPDDTPIDPATEDTTPNTPVPDPAPAEPAPDPATEDSPVIEPPIEEKPPTDEDVIAKAVEIQTVYAVDYPWVVASMDAVALKVDEGNEKAQEHDRFYSYKPAHAAADNALRDAIKTQDAQFVEDMAAMLKDTVAYIVEDLARDRKAAVVGEGAVTP